MIEELTKIQLNRVLIIILMGFIFFKYKTYYLNIYPVKILSRLANTLKDIGLAIFMKLNPVV